jgi:hypothetical protein
MMAGGSTSCLLLLLVSRFHVIEDPVPHNKEPGDDHVGEQSTSEECRRDEDLVVHRHSHHPSGEC